MRAINRNERQMGEKERRGKGGRVIEKGNQDRPTCNTLILMSWSIDPISSWTNSAPNPNFEKHITHIKLE